MRTKTDEYIRARYNMTCHFMVSEVLDKSTDYKHGPLFQEELIPGFQQGFHCVILDLKDLPSHLFRRIVTFNN